MNQRRRLLLAVATLALACGTLLFEGVSSNPKVDDGIARMPLGRDSNPIESSTPIASSFGRAPLAEPVADLFATKSWIPPPPVVSTAPVKPPPPSAPPLPFRYVGQMTDSTGQLLVYLARGEDVLIVRVGEQLAGSYRLDSIDEAKLVLTFIPLNQQQMLVIPPR